jgi:hypothetical protein
MAQLMQRSTMQRRHPTPARHTILIGKRSHDPEVYPESRGDGRPRPSRREAAL